MPQEQQIFCNYKLGVQEDDAEKKEEDTNTYLWLNMYFARKKKFNSILLLIIITCVCVAMVTR
jgi:t-SNARE complex subunit (syntaxin)